ncbi:MAG: RHS repeat-associated core domain-containing protein [Leptospiraceae bacterium]|nr:RHS repeat-associated core domain-containing protein [Leptospiraceae bacterium]
MNSYRFICCIFFLVFANCLPQALTGKKAPPFWLLASYTNKQDNVISEDTPSVSEPNNNNPASPSSPSTPVNGNTGETKEDCTLYQITFEGCGQKPSGTSTNTNTTSPLPPTGNQTNPPTNTGGGGNSGSAPGTPAMGMYFFHPDHLGSVSMVTDASGNMVSGVDIDTGKSYITYKPYGEVNRTNSSGPDIFRYKYTGQEEDPETGLYYYKSRYYDPAIGRFIQPDTVMQPESTFGMNLYMYVEGNPVMYTDPDGHWKLSIKTLGNLNRFLIPIGLGTKAIFGYRKAERNRKRFEQMEAYTGLYLLSNSNITAQKFLAMYFLGKYMGQGPKGVLFGHNYTGDGNRDNFAKFNIRNNAKRIKNIIPFYFGIKLLNQSIFKDDPITDEQFLGFISITKLLAPRAKSFSDSLAIGHDREVPAKMFSGSSCQHFRADMNYAVGFLNGVSTGKAFQQPIDSLVGLGGSFLLGGIDAPISTLRSAFGGCR